MSLKHALLGLLTYGPMTGYDLKTIFDKSINYFWTASTSQIYRDLGALEDEGLATSRIEPQEGRPDKKIYTITDTGREAFSVWLNRFPATLDNPVRSDFMLRIFFGSRIPLEDLRFQFQRFTKEMQEISDTIKETMAKNGKAPSEIVQNEKLFWGMTGKMGLISAEAAITWAKECIKDIDAYMAEKNGQVS